MRKLAIGMLFGMLLISVSCASINSARHNYIMKGQILEVNEDGVYLCIGSNDGAVVGQEYSVHKFTKIVDPASSKRNQPYYKMEQTGTVKITEIVDEHYAKAKIINGEAQINYAVELKQ